MTLIYCSAFYKNKQFTFIALQTLTMKMEGRDAFLISLHLGSVLLFEGLDIGLDCISLVLLDS